MKKTLLTLSILSLCACEIDNSGKKQLPADFNNEFSTEVGFFGTEGEGLTVELTTGHGKASGTLGVTDVNFGEAEFVYDKITAAEYGTFTLHKFEGTDNYNDEWTYELNVDHQEVAAIMNDPNGELTDSITLTSLDGTTNTLNFVIKGVQEGIPAEFKGAVIANVARGGDAATAFGRALVYDENYAQSAFIDAAHMKNDNDEPMYPDAVPKYGSINIEPDGKWTYELNKQHPDLAHLVEDEEGNSPPPVTETFNLYSVDGSTQEFKVNITAAPKNFAASVPTSKDKESVLKINFGNEISKTDTESGKITFKLKPTSDLAKEANIGFGCGRWNTEQRRMINLYASFDGTLAMWSAALVPGGSYKNGADDYARDSNNRIITEKVVFDQMLKPDDWTLIEMTWEHKNSYVRPKMTLKVDGEKITSDHKAIPVNPNERFLAQTLAGSSIYGCLQQMRLEVEEDESGAGALLIDDIRYFSEIDADIQFDAPVFEETFSNSEEGTPLIEVSSQRYSDVTTDNVLVVESSL
ncbi:Large exoprotein [Catenovulum agarivorans DS-2]|uniref:Large exoprotein n=1 Tax=Catenovulum agarivorans DS-2 TaxID=1328313 RepID=W7QF30_9ALTE|nr:VCBS domain-containing protein [Catenovulum agarivorans]EWH10531.1 Large exoprotein [Catenovulum agarivorans DS-2]